MDHIGVVKRAWRITWRYRALWILGLFAGGAGGGGGGGGGRGFNSFNGGGTSGGTSRLEPGFQQFTQWVQAHVALLVVAGAALFVVVLLLWIVGIAARGGLVWLSNEAAEEREVRAGAGWRAGFHFWGRTFLIGLLLALPVLLVAFLIGMAIVLFGVAAGLFGGAHNAGAAAGSILGLCGVAALAFVVLVPLAIVIGLLSQLALRHGVLDDMPAVDAIKAAWWDLRNRLKDVLVIWVLLVAISIAYGIVVGIVAIALIAPSALLVFAGAWPLAIVLGLVAFLILLLPTAIFSTFYSTTWTVFFRRLTGREVEPPKPAYAPGYPATGPPAGGYPPPPPGQAPGYPAPSAPGGFPPPPPQGYPPPTSAV